MASMFYNADAFNQNIGAWNVEKVTNMSSMFQNNGGFNNSGSSDINNWRPISCSNFSSMFQSATAFNQPIGNWTLPTASNIAVTMSSMFNNADAFNQNIGAWNVEKVTNMSGMFSLNGGFNNSGSSDINNWRPISCSNFSGMFFIATAFNQPIGNWPLSASNINMSSMFRDATVFNNGGSSNINNWDTSAVINMQYMFYESAFDQPIGNWNTSAVTDMLGMFLVTNFNQDISTKTVNGGQLNEYQAWDTSNVTNMSSMFEAAIVFNQPIGNWDTSAVTNMNGMFAGATAFNQDLGAWNISNVTDMTNMLNSSGIDIPNYTKTLRGWGNLANTTGVQTAVPLGASGKKYGAAHAQRKVLTDTYGWTITDGGQEPFVFTINTTASGYTAGTELTFTLPLTQNTLSGYPLDILVNWGDSTTSTISQSAQLDRTHTYSNSGSYEITITGSLFGFNFNNGGDKAKLTDVKKWSAFESSTAIAFYECSNLSGSATDAPFISNDSLTFYFRGCTNFNGAVGNWDISSVTSINEMFNECTNFNQNLSNWDMSNVTTTNQMFSNTTQFNNGGSEGINDWNTSNVTNMGGMFGNALAFNQDIGNWNVSKVTNFGIFMLGKSTEYDPNYMDSIFNNWPNYKLKPNLTGVNFGSINYTANGVEGKALLERPHITASITNIDVSASLFQIQATSIVSGLSVGNRITISGSGNPVLDKAHPILQILDINTFTVDVPFTASAIQGEVITGYGWTMITGSQI
jgi:trimeric autotransporter adhesin